MALQCRDKRNKSKPKTTFAKNFEPMSKRAAGPTAGSAAKKARAPSTPGLPALKKELDMLDKKQLLEMLLELAKEAGVEAVRKLAPPADLGKIIKELNQKVNAVSTAMGRYSNGDAFCWKKAKGKNGSARTALVAAANKFRSTKNWPVAHDFAVRALKVAEGLPEFREESCNEGRNKAIGALEKLRDDAAAHL